MWRFVNSLFADHDEPKEKNTSEQLDTFWRKLLPRPLAEMAVEADNHVREGKFQRSLALVAGGASAVGGLEVAYEHYKGGYAKKIMWTPVILSGAMTAAGTWGFFDRWAARTVLRWVSAITLVDSVVGFYFHARGVARKPGGWRLPMANIVMGPPIFAPLLFGVSAYLGLIASYLQPEEGDLGSEHARRWTANDWRDQLREGKFQKHLALATVFSAIFSGFEAYYSHYKTNFKYKAQWSPVIIAPMLATAAALSIRNKNVARTWLPAVSLLAIADGGIGFYYHARGVIRRPGGLKKPVYNILYGPPLFAPLLFAACGVLGLLAYLMRRERK